MKRARKHRRFCLVDKEGFPVWRGPHGPAMLFKSRKDAERVLVQTNWGLDGMRVFRTTDYDRRVLRVMRDCKRVVNSAAYADATKTQILALRARLRAKHGLATVLAL